MKKTQMTIALAGNPNSGKTTLFNNMTGGRQHVGNYPGVTVEKKEGFCRHGDKDLKIVDLPGTYSLTAYSVEEIVARNFIIHEKPDVVINVIDASNLERNLYLTVQLRELGVPVVLAFNMSDVAKARGLEFNLDLLSSLLGAPIVPTVGSRKTGIGDLLDHAIRAAGEGPRQPPDINYGKEVGHAISFIAERLGTYAGIRDAVESRWTAIKLLENDKDVIRLFQNPALDRCIQTEQQRIETILGDTAEMIIADRRYGFISGACQEAVRSTVEMRHTHSDRIDEIVIHRVWGLPIFLGLMYLVFWLTFTVGGPPMDWIDSFFGWLGSAIATGWPGQADSALLSLLVDGVIAGVGGVIVFMPNILLLFLAIAILEDSGYMARAAFMMDRIMHKIGLHGKSFIPMLTGFGCSIPAIMATRTLESRRDRLTTMLVLPLISCGARLPIYALIIPAFFPKAWHAPMLWLIYIIGMLLAIVCAKILRATLFKGETVPFVMELPPYRLPTLKGVLIHMWERGGLYLKKAGTVILGISIILWALTSYPKTDFPHGGSGATPTAEHTTPGGSGSTPTAEHTPPGGSGSTPTAEHTPPGGSGSTPTAEHTSPKLSGSTPTAAPAVAMTADEQQSIALSNTIAGRIGHAMEPLIKPLGFDWRIGTAMIGAFAAKEVFVAQLGIVYSVGEADEESEPLRDKLKANYSPLTGFCIMLFMLISAPCMATIAVTRRESNSWRWALFQLGGLTLLAYVLTLIVYQTGTLLGLGAQ